MSVLSFLVDFFSVDFFCSLVFGSLVFCGSLGFGCSLVFFFEPNRWELLLDGFWEFDKRLGKVSKGTSGSRKLSRVGRGLNRGIAAPYVIYINSSAGNITYIPGLLDSSRRAPGYTYTTKLDSFNVCI